MMLGQLLPENARTRKVLVMLLGGALAIHLISDIGVYALRPGSISTTPDPLDYRLAALNLLHHGTFSISPADLHVHELLRTPAYPAVVAAGYLIDGETGLAIIILQSLLLIAMGWLLFRLLVSFQLPDTLALVLTALYLFEPLQWLYTLETMTETLSSFFILALITAALTGKGISTLGRAVAFGVVLGLAIFEKPSVEMWAPFLLALIFVALGSWRERLLRSGVAALVCVAVLSPWLIRNHSFTHHWLVSSSGQYNFIYMFGADAPGVPPAYSQPLATVSYSGHTNQTWYAYTTDAYPMLLGTVHTLWEHTSYRSIVMRQLTCAPHVWFGFAHPENEEAYGHEYALISDFVLGPGVARDWYINKLDTIVWSLVLALTVLGSFLLLGDARLRSRFLPLLGMLCLTVGLNFCGSWTRMLLPVYPVIVLASGAAIACLLRKGRLPRA